MLQLCLFNFANDKNSSEHIILSPTSVIVLYLMITCFVTVGACCDL